MVATGGGTFVDAQNRAVINRDGLSVWLDAPIDRLIARVPADGRRPPWPGATFDRVLLDVPCSGLGALRRRPEARWRKAESDLPALTELQRALLRFCFELIVRRGCFSPQA